MNLVPSVSRSSGLQDDGDKLKDLKFQEEYLSFIENKLQNYWQQYPIEPHLASLPDDKQKHVQHNISILFRKLREGILASNRLDELTLRVYQISLDLSVIFRMPTQTTAIITQLVPHRHKEVGLYQSVPARITSELASPSALTKGMETLSLKNTPKPPQGDKKTKSTYQPPHRRRDQNSDKRGKPPAKPLAKPHVMNLASRIELTILISLLNALVCEYPRQDSCHILFWRFYCLDKGTFWRKHSASFRYIKRLMEVLAINNLARFERLSRDSSVKELCVQIMSSSKDLAEEYYLTQIAIMVLLNDLRSKVRSKAWEVLRVAYREVDSMLSEEWLAKALLLPVAPADDSPSRKKYIDTWFLDRPRTQVVPKEGQEGRWILRR